MTVIGWQIATNAQGQASRNWRSFVCVGSAVVATPPIPDRLAAIGWTGGESITDSQATVTYYRTTRDGRIVRHGWRLYFTGEPGPAAFSCDHGGIAAADRPTFAAFIPCWRTSRRKELVVHRSHLRQLGRCWANSRARRTSSAA
ncbi:MAG: hypothetical protein R3F45_02630 [Gammaproteobacteria bacterium]